MITKDFALWLAPNQRRVWDATCLTDLALCPTRYQYARVDGLRSIPRDTEPRENPHTTFGHLLHGMTQQWDLLQYKRNASADECSAAALEWAVREAWGENDAPFGGFVLAQWRCTGVLRQGASGRRKYLCDAARDWWVGTDEACPHCGLPTQTKVSYVPEHAHKNLISLARAVVAYEEHRAQSPWEVAMIAEQPALERTLMAPLPGTQYMLVGTLDRISRGPGGALWVHERKTTGMTPTNSWWASFELRLQIGLYLWLCRENGISVHGAIVECFHISASGVDVSERTFSRTPAQLEEMIEQTKMLIVAHDRPSHNFSVCDHASGGMPCQYRSICAAPPADRADVIALNYAREPLWNPLTAKHDDDSQEGVA